MLASEKGDLPPELWLRAADELKSCSPADQPEIMLWGGEPLLYPQFDELAEQLFRRGFKLSIVTNGTLLHEHLETAAKYISTVNISLDGGETLHDAVRGNGVFRRVADNLEKFNAVRQGRLVFLTTLSDVNIDRGCELPFELAKLGCDQIVLQGLMYLSPREIDAFRAYCQTHFSGDYPELIAWCRKDDSDYLRRIDAFRKNFENTRFPVETVFTPHVYPGNNAGVPPCEAPWKRVHIRHDGEVGFCTDYFAFSAGNITRNSLNEIFAGPRAALFRQAVMDNALAICNHCPWHLQQLPGGQTPHMERN